MRFITKAGPSSPIERLGWWCSVLLLLWQLGTLPHQRRPIGDYGGDLTLLSYCHTRPAPGESNHFLDLWSEGAFRGFAKQHGLSNNHTLFVLSHGGAVTGYSKRGYAYYPDKTLTRESEHFQYSARDLAKTVGHAVTEIHNLVIAGCDAEGVFDPAELRLCFPHATNIIHTPTGRNGFELALRHFVMYPSRDIRLLYATPDNFEVGKFELRALGQTNKTQPMPYLARLYRPGETKPYRIQTAGRELLAATASPVTVCAGGSNDRAPAGDHQLSAQASDRSGRRRL